MSAVRSELLAHFSCIGERCVDTCCHGWSMQVDDLTLARYKKSAPELMAAVEPSPESPWVMRKDSLSGYCVKYENGLCGIQKRYGESMLGDACHFYPRVTRMLGDVAVMTATLSCPEIARLALAEQKAVGLEPFEMPARLPGHMKNILPEELSVEQALALHQLFLDAPEKNDASAEQVFSCIASVARSLELIDKKEWPNAAPVYLRLAGGRLPAAQPLAEDPFNLVHALCGLAVASHKPVAPRLQRVLDDMQAGLRISFDWKTARMELADTRHEAYKELREKWAAVAQNFDVYLKRYLQMQLALSFFPFSGLGDDLPQRATLIGVRLATIKLAIMCAYGRNPDEPPQDMVVRVVQSLSRFLDHLGDPAFSLEIYAEAGWLREAGLRGLLLL